MMGCNKLFFGNTIINDFYQFDREIPGLGSRKIRVTLEKLFAYWTTNLSLTFFSAIPLGFAGAPKVAIHTTNGKYDFILGHNAILS